MVWAVRNGLLRPLVGGCTLWRSSSGASWGTTLTIPHTTSPSPASATRWRRGEGQDRGYVTIMVL